jgi:F-type H+-transporting ATPase subunit delta
MSNGRIATRYAKSLIGLAIERNELDEVFADMQWLQSVCKGNSNFVNMLRSPVIKSDAKGKIVTAVAKDSIGQLTGTFMRLLITKGREGILPEISTEFIRQYKEYKKIYSVRVTTAVPISDELKEGIVRYIKSNTKLQNLELETVVREDILGGVILQLEDKIVDASISYDFKQIAKLFENNDFIYKIR